MSGLFVGTLRPKYLLYGTCLEQHASMSPYSYESFRLNPKSTQRSQYPLIKEYILKHNNKAPII